MISLRTIAPWAALAVATAALATTGRAAEEPAFYREMNF